MGEGAADTGRTYLLGTSDYRNDNQIASITENIEILKGEGAAIDYETSIEGELK